MTATERIAEIDRKILALQDERAHLVQLKRVRRLQAIKDKAAARAAGATR